MDYVLLIIGLVTLIVGGEFLVKGAVGFSAAMRISPLVIGMTVVAFGTSAPELLVSITSAMKGNSGIAVGNVVGSNIANLALVLGATVLLYPIMIDRQTKLVDFPMMMFATLLFYFFAMDGVLSFSDGLILFTVLVVFVTLLISSSRRNWNLKEFIPLSRKKRAERFKKDTILDLIEEQVLGDEDEDEDDDNDDDDDDDDDNDDGKGEEYKKEPFWKSISFLTIGLVGLYFGAEWFIDGAVGIAEVVLAGNPDKDVIIGVTVVALGTSAPELVASIVAAYRKQTDLSIGNLIGSNIFNIFAVLGITSMIQPIEVTQAVIEFDMLWVIGVALFLLFALVTKNRIGRFDGVIFLLTYIAYITVIVLRVKGIV